MRRRDRRAVAVALGITPLIALLAPTATAPAAHPDLDDPAASAAARGPQLANRCVVLSSVATGRPIGIRNGAYGARGDGRTSFHMKPSRLRAYLLHDRGGMLLAAGEAERVERRHDPGRRAEWLLRRGPARTFTLAASDRRRLAVEPRTGALKLVEPGAAGARAVSFRIHPRRRCARFPEAEVGARGRPSAGTRPDGSVLGFADTHLHVTANLRAGGRVIHGQPFHRFGISEALGHDEDDHGPDGSLDVTGNLLRDGSPVGTHDTHGWPTFTGWPVHDTMTHQQAYYVWLKRAWKAGLRLIVAQAVEDQALCELQPLRSHSCDETATVKLAIRQLRRLERYVDAQSGGRGRGWFRLVGNPRQARRVISRGKLAVVIGMETSSPLGCSEFAGEPQCTRADVDRVLDELHGLGVRSLFVAHWVDNGYGGAALQGGAQGDFINLFQVRTTGQPFATEPCGDADEADGRCNSKGFTALGRYLIERMMDKGMLIEADHLSQKAREAVFRLAERRDYPLVSSHTGTGGEWTPEQLERLAGVGGISSATPETAPELVDKLLRLRRHADRSRRRAVSFGSDTGGFSSLPGPREEGERLTYPFRSYDGEVRFFRQRTGERVYDLNDDGVAHYGLVADLIADIGRQRRGGRALRSLFGSAEAYLRMWRQARRNG